MTILDPRLTAASDKIEELKTEIERLNNVYISVVIGRKKFRGLYLKARTRLAKADALAEAATAIEPYLDAIICFASTTGEHEPNKIAKDFRTALTDYQEGK